MPLLTAGASHRMVLARAGWPARRQRPVFATLTVAPEGADGWFVIQDRLTAQRRALRADDYCRKMASLRPRDYAPRMAFDEESFNEFLDEYPELLAAGEVPSYTADQLEAQWQAVLRRAAELHPADLLRGALDAVPRGTKKGKS